ncbi:MAG: DUF3141 domain-containing protein, partial [Acetobacteraceae bacterium]|nr:DUF3141 domain-containing protein [Acetobacteraceae bacterium]
RSLANLPMAELSRQLHPLRAQRWALSDLNPMLWPVAVAATAVRADRRPCAADNPFRVLEREVATAVEKGFDAMAEARDKAAERTFEALYATPLARAAAGLANAPTPQPLGADPVRRELARREARELLAGAAEGTVRDGIVRILLLLFNESGAIDEQTYRAVQAVRGELPPRHRASPPEMREIARRQALLLRADREAAVRGLATIFAAPKDRAMAEAVLRKAAEAVGARIDMTPRGPVASLLNAKELPAETA